MTDIMYKNKKSNDSLGSSDYVNILKSRINQQRIVSKLGMIALKGKQLQELLDIIVHEIFLGINVEFIKVLEFDSNKQSFKLRAAMGWNSNVIINKTTLSAKNNSMAAYTIKFRRPVIIVNLPYDKRFQTPTLLEQHKVKSGISIMIHGPKRIPYGVLGVYTSKTIKYNSDDINFLQAVANIIALAIERNLIENELTQSQKRVNVSLEAGKLAAWYWNFATNTITWSDKSFIIFGIKNKNLLPKNSQEFFQLIDKQDHVRFRNMVDRAKVSGKKIKFSFQSTYFNPHPKWLKIDAMFVSTLKSKDSLTGVIYDITESRNSLLEEVFLSKASKILSSSLNYKITLKKIANLAVIQMADWCSVEIIENNQIKSLVITHIDSGKRKWARELRKKYPPRLDESRGLVQVLKNGISEIYPFIDKSMYESSAKTAEELKLLIKLNIKSAIIVPIKNNEKIFGAIQLISTNEHNLYNLHHLKTIEELSVRIALAIENAELYSNAQKAIQIREEFISMASHELKNPLASMLLYTSYLQKVLYKTESKNKNIIDPLGKIQIQINRLNKLINDLLNVSNIQLGKLEFNKGLIDLQKLIEEITENIQITNTSHKIHIIGVISRKVWADSDRIRQVYTNLLTNAIKYSPNNNEIRVTIKAGNKSVKISVQDFGIGIGKKNLKHVFDRFYRAENAKNGNFTGLGLGLYIAKNIIQRHSGKMSVKSEIDHGSTFSFTLPFHSK